MIIRPETSEDVSAIRTLTADAFASDPIGNRQEHLLIDALRAADRLLISLVLEIDRAVVGHISFTKVLINKRDLNVLGLAPLSVAPDFQGRGLGSALARAGLQKLKKTSVRACVVLGDPHYYGRFGFYTDAGIILPGVPPEYFQAIAISGSIPFGTVTFDPLFAQFA